MIQNFENYLLATTQATACRELEMIQSLWSGYGKISRYQLEGASKNTVVVKCIALNQINAHPRGWGTSKSHARKVKSYEVETYWYENWNQRCTSNCVTPKFLGSFAEGKNQWIVLEDLDDHYPIRKYDLTLEEVKACLKWLANFHACFIHEKPTGLWKVGTYWHLATRPDEFKKIENFRLKSRAHLIDRRLNDCKFQTIVHGDAKLANFCFSNDGKEIAAVDFQYVGGGCGIKDVAYFLGSCLSSSECERLETGLLNHYFEELQTAINDSVNFIALEQEWRELYAFACTDFTRFMLGWMPTHQKVNRYNLKLMNKVLEAL